jgi:glycine dehydrogenase subunit 1
VFNEFVLELPKEAGAVHRRLLEKGIVAGLPLERYFPERKKDLLICVTEAHGKGAIDRLAASLKEAL